MAQVADKLIMDNLPVGTCIFRVDQEGSYHAEYLNDAILSKCGFSGDEIAYAMENDPSLIVHPDDVERFSLMLYRAGVTGGKFSDTIRIRLSDGSFGWIDIRLNAIVENDASVLLYFVIIDVDNQKEYDFRLEHTYEQLMGVMNNAPGGIIVFDSKNNRDAYPAYISPGMSRLLGRSPNEQVTAFSTNYTELIHPDDIEVSIRAMEEAIRNLTPFKVTARLLQGNGRYKWVSATGTAASYEGRRSVYVTVTDSSEDQESKQLFQNIVDILVERQFDILCAVDVELRTFKILSVDKKLADYLPNDNDDYDTAIRSIIDSFIIPEEREYTRLCLDLDSICKTLKTKGSVDLYVTASLPGHKLHYKRMWVCWLDETHRNLAFVLSDYTDLRMQQLTQQNELLGALRAAEQANVAKSVFLSRMSHDIRTPLNAIIGYTGISLGGNDLPPAVRDRLEKTYSASRYLLTLVNDVLDMSRIESGKLILSSAPFKITELTDEIQAIIAPQCAARSQDFQIVLDSSVRTEYVGDLPKLQQILINMLGNSVKFTPNGGKVSIRIEETAYYDNHSIVRFTIEDNGRGISEEFLPHIFDAFTQEDLSGLSQQGTGLGLAICKSIVSMMKGTISVESKNHHGTKFVIELQLAAAEEGSSAAVDAAKNSCGYTGSSCEDSNIDFSGANVLIAEDNKMNMEIACSLLESRGFNVDCAENGRIACNMFAGSDEGTYEAVLLDIRMPVMDGIEAARTIRAMDRSDSKTIPLIAMSADAFEEDISRSLSNGINAHLIKPIDPNELFRTLSAFIAAK